ncbi:hypothetical protein SPONL_282 [uncultured Candidatus Thioglobus sp.]|nr:hypothetical protein SPONL_282 [uncultured Candidatus Thioglobus sp.]
MPRSGKPRYEAFVGQAMLCVHLDGIAMNIAFDGVGAFWRLIRHFIG